MTGDIKVEFPYGMAFDEADFIDEFGDYVDVDQLDEFDHAFGLRLEDDEWWPEEGPIVGWIRQPVSWFPAVSRATMTLVAASAVVVISAYALLATSGDDVQLDASAGGAGPSNSASSSASSPAPGPVAQSSRLELPTGASPPASGSPDGVAGSSAGAAPANSSDSSAEAPRLPVSGNSSDTSDVQSEAQNQVTATTAAQVSTTSLSSAPTSTELILSTTVGGGPVVSGGVWDYYGNPWVPSDLANLTLQGGERFSYRFVAKHT
ncbi:MAG: hypothetical protein GY724_17390, partial [Actinomycetia bacterium]|nr:hypothetical protein [Actinomycetes bacterium]MCP5031897.1 hypothetical protein [Actinomycetes bacterium]